MLKAGELNTRITILRETKTYDEYNAPVPVWVSAETVWAVVITTGGREYYAAQKLNAETSAVFKIRYTSAINVRMRIKLGNSTYAIISINDVDNKHTELQISAKEVV